MTAPLFLWARARGARRPREAARGQGAGVVGARHAGTRGAGAVGLWVRRACGGCAEDAACKARRGARGQGVRVVGLRACGAQGAGEGAKVGCADAVEPRARRVRWGCGCADARDVGTQGAEGARGQGCWCGGRGGGRGRGAEAARGQGVRVVGVRGAWAAWKRGVQGAEDAGLGGQGEGTQMRWGCGCAGRVVGARGGRGQGRGRGGRARPGRGAEDVAPRMAFGGRCW